MSLRLKLSRSQKVRGIFTYWSTEPLGPHGVGANLLIVVNNIQVNDCDSKAPYRNLA